MQKYIIQKMYDYIGNTFNDKNTEKYTKAILDKFKDKLSTDEQEELLSMLMVFDRSSFEAGIMSVCAFFSGNNKF